MKPLLSVLFLAAALCACKRETFHEEVETSLSSRTINTNSPELGTDPNVRQDTKQGSGEKTSGASSGLTEETKGGGSQTGAGGAGPGYYGGGTNAPK